MVEPLSTIVAHFEGSEEEAANYEFYGEGYTPLNGDSQPAPGQEWFFVLRVDGSAEITNVKATNGDCYQVGTNPEMSTTDTCLFVETNSEDSRPSISKPFDNGLSTYWFGNVGTGLVVKDDKTLDITGGDVPCVAEVTYNTRYDSLWKLVPGDIVFRTAEELGQDDPESSYTIHIVVYLRSTA